MRIALMGILAAPLLLAACGGDDGPQVLSDTEHNDADVAFATDMIPHHAQALAMVELTRDRPLDPQVESLVEQISAAQTPEIELMADWLVDWDEEVPDTMRDYSHAGHGDASMEESMEGMDHGDMPGMMSAEEMTALEDAADADFQTMWLEMMVEHHEGAIEMAQTEQAEGEYRPAVELAGEIVEGQSAEIETMQDLLAG
jgi:uncharacterized protein (DUF305 family)